MTTAMCKRCRVNPVQDMYSKFGFCNSCGRYKQKWDSLSLGFRGMGVGSGLLLAIFIIISNFRSNFEIYVLISWLIVFLCFSIFGYSFSRSKYKQ